MQHLTAQSIIKATATLLLAFLLHSTYAALPPSINYQGHLTDSSGTPIDGPVNMIFAIYDVDSGGSALWNDTRSVTVDQGVFSVELGGTSNPFPVGLFENPLWMGLSVGSDAEMTPRRPLSSTAYSFKADDANTLEGVSASTLDQSAHVIDTANPHGITSSQIGAADAAALSAHTGDTANPHSVTADQAGAASNADFTTHTGDSAAHHTRFTSGEAVTAMGTKSDTNPLHHDKYTDANVVTAMLANDGAGSTLDSDKVDGLEASELIDAAQDEVRTPISSLPYTINTPGSYYLTGNLNGSSGGINIDTADVTLDLMGFTIDGHGYSDYGISIDSAGNITITNGTVKNFAWTGIIQLNPAARYITIIDVRVLINGPSGTGNTRSGIYLLGSNNHIERCLAASNGGFGIYTLYSSKLVDNTAHDNGGSYGIYGGTGSTLSGNTAYGNSFTGIYGSNGSRLVNNTAYLNGDYGVFGGSGSTLEGNTAYDNTGTGIYGGTSAALTGNVAYSNDGLYGIYGGSGSNLKSNTAYNNTGNYGIFAAYGANLSSNVVFSNDGTYGLYGSSGASIIGNTAYSNSYWGIYANGSNNIRDNTAYNNNSTNTDGYGGIRAGNDSQVVNNTMDGNWRINLYVGSNENAIIDNQTNDSVYGIYFAGSPNYWRNNIAWSNTYNFGGTIPAGGYDGGGNVGF